MRAQAAASKAGPPHAKQCRRLIIRITSTIWQQAALVVNRRRPLPDIRIALVTLPRCLPCSGYLAHYASASFSLHGRLATPPAVMLLADPVPDNGQFASKGVLVMEWRCL